jgi:outer membrane protein assembly factor BamA
MFNLRFRNHPRIELVRCSLKYYRLVGFLWVLSLLGACNYTKHLTQNQTLLNENRLILKTEKPIKYKGETESVILSLVNPKANSHLFDLGILPKYKLWKYNKKYNVYEKNLMHPKLIKHKVEKPALLDSMQIVRSKTQIEQYMENLGFFYARVDYEIKPKSAKTADVLYTINAGKNYTLRNINVVSDNTEIGDIIKHNMNGNFLVSGQPFTKINCGLERDRLYKIIRNEGFHDFKADNISFTIDTTNKDVIRNLLEDPFSVATTYTPAKENKTIDVNLIVTQSRDSTYGLPYFINNVRVTLNAANEPGRNEDDYVVSTLNDIEFYYASLPVNRSVIANNIFIHRGDRYNTRDYEITINRLNQLGVFQLVNITYEKIPDMPGKLNCLITLNTSPKMDLVTLMDLSTSDDDYFLGIGGGITFRNKNLAHGANLLSIRASYSTEFRNDAFLNGTKTFYQSGNNINLSSNLTLPKFIIPFSKSTFSKKNMPYTIIGANYSFIQRIKNYTIINLSGSFGYTWQETRLKSWRFNPVFLTLTQVPDRYLSNEFREKRETNSYLRNTFSNNLIQGENVLFEYRSKPKLVTANFSTLKVGVEEAGTILNLVQSAYRKISSDSLQSIARYVKGDIDFRKYLNRRKAQWANRIMIGVGVPVGNSRTLPFIKQYSAGGAFSNRGWRARNLGPGRSADTSFQSGFVILDKTGDIKFEANTEYRFNLLKLFSGAINLKGAAFIDAGNIWLMQKDSSVVGGEFDWSFLAQDIAISAGLGLRLDFSFFVFRLDYGYPFKQPQVKTNYGFTFDRLRYSSGLWNLGLGYPF